MSNGLTPSRPQGDDDLRRRHLEIYGHLPLRPMAIHELEPSLLTGRQPLSELDARELAGRGITHVLDLREEREWRAAGRHGAAAVAELAALGVERFAASIPDGEAPDPATLDLAVEFLDQAAGEGAGRAYVHCRAGIERTGTVVLAYRAWRDGTTVDAAFAALDTPDSPYAPLPWQVEAVRRWLAARRRESRA